MGLSLFIAGLFLRCFPFSAYFCLPLRISPRAGGPLRYDALAAAGEAAGLIDVRAAAGVRVVDYGAHGYSWKGWDGEKFCRRENVEKHGAARGQDSSRFDQMFASRDARIKSTGVVEEAEWAGASDHVPIVTEFFSEQERSTWRRWMGRLGLPR